jgi:hypothetical protein
MVADPVRDWTTRRTPNLSVDRSTAILDRVTIGPINDEETLNFLALCRVVGKNMPDSELLRAITILTTSKFSALKVRAKLRDEDGKEHDVAPEELSAAVSSATPTLLHPTTRRTVEGFEKRLMIYFVPSTIFENPPASVRALI